MYGKYREKLKHELKEIAQSGLYKSERHITSAQQARINVGENQVLNMCANNYLGLANNSEIIDAVKTGLDQRGFGMASVRFICGTQDIHSELENKISRFFGTDDTILYSSCFDANAGLFETLLSERDAIISDALNHASIIDGIRLCKAARFRYSHGDMAALENCLNEAADAKTRMIATDGVFSMDGDYAKLDSICELAEIMMPLLWWTTAMPPVLWDPRVAAHRSFTGFRTRSMSSPQLWEKHWVVLPAASPPDARISSNYSGSAPDLTYSPIPWHRPLSRQP